MNSESNDTVTTCKSCQKRPATTTFTNRSGKWSERVCEPCLDLLELQETFEWGMIETRERTKQERYNKILAWLDNFEEANLHRDQDQWLARQLAHYRAFTLWDADRYDEALKAYDVVEQFGFKNVTDKWSLAGFRARCFEGLEKHDEALAVFEAAFREQEPRFLSSARYHLPILVELSANAGKPVDESWRQVALDVAEEFAVEFPVRATLAESMLALFELTEGKPSRKQREWEAKNPSGNSAPHETTEKGSSG